MQLLLPHLTQFKIDHPEASENIDALIPILQAGRPYTCIKCAGKGEHTIDDSDSTKIICTLCEGYGKTVTVKVEKTQVVGYEDAPEEG